MAGKAIPLITTILSRVGIDARWANTQEQVSVPKEIEKELDPTGSMAVRSSEVENTRLFGNLLTQMDTATPAFELELLNLLEHLAKYNPDISYAIDNIVQLGNTPAVISFDDGVSPEQAKDMRKYLQVAEQVIYSGGMNSLQNDLFAQLAYNGALSAEAIPHRSLKYIAQVVLVPVHTIRFKYNSSTYKYDAYQKASMEIEPVKLNKVQYKYYALRRFSNSPYAIPPFLSALDGLELEKDMLKNVKNVIRKLGLFGFLKVMVSAPIRKQGETDEAYYQRSAAYLEQLRPQAEKGFAAGVMLGFKGHQELDMEATSSNVEGARDMMNAITERVHSGIKQDPLMLGRNFNVAETMARVIMAKLTTQVANYQRVVATFRADLYMMMLRMAGYTLSAVTVEYDPPMIGDKLREEQAFKAKIENRITLRDRGVINQLDVAHELGYDEPHADKDVDYSVPSAAEMAKKPDPSKADPTQAQDPTAAGATNYSIEYYHASLHRGAAEYMYVDEDCANCKGIVSYAKDKKTTGLNVDDYITMYKTQITGVYKKSIDNAILKIGEALAELGDGATLQQFSDKVFYTLYKEWSVEFTAAQSAIVKKWVTEIYSSFRKDNSYMGSIKAPEATFGLFDVRALTYFSNSDSLYISKFITDKDTVKGINTYLKEAYLRDNTPIGNNTKAIARFKSEFTDLMLMEDWKIRRIIDTSVNRMRNAAALSYMQQAGVMSFEVRGVNDGAQCAYCKSVQGKQFNVGVAYNRVDEALQSMPEFVKDTMPFVTSVFKGADGIELFKNSTSHFIQSKGIDVPPYHGHCRDVIVAVL